MSSPLFTKSSSEKGANHRTKSPRYSLHGSDIPVSRTSAFGGTRISGQHRGSVSTGNKEHAASWAEFSSSLPPALKSPTPQQPKKLCEACGCDEAVSAIWNCAYCNANLCDPCWDKQLAHKPGKLVDGLPHEKADPNVVERLKSILTPPKEQSEQQLLHLEDEDTTWFGIGRTNQNQPIFQDYGRYSQVMADTNTGDHKLRYPQLVSFIGQTGAGKSTLIKMLIDQQERRLKTHNITFPSPVVGSVTHENVPTSGDVHLYNDPATCLGEFPMLYADCEGLEGGEHLPISAQYRNAAPLQRDDRKDNHGHRKRRKSPKRLHCKQRRIDWADSFEKQKRQYAVTELYPRLLYTFSDVIVFVLRNPKTFEATVLSLLIEWASSSMEKSLNQPTLPHAVIALNATDMGVNSNEWDPDHATQTLMSHVSSAIHDNYTYRQLTEDWRAQGRRIWTMQDLLECYYSSITVVRIPAKGRYMLIDEQVDKLRSVLTVRCNESFRAKRRSRMLSNSEELNVYLQCAFDHFSHDLYTPFNFMDVAFKISPIPSDFGGSILKLAIAMGQHAMGQHKDAGPRKIFEELSYMVASCILLDCSRQGLKGNVDQILRKMYMEYCDSALDDFCAIFWPCAYNHSKKGRCVNVKERHTKGHQNAKGQIIGSGPYQSDFTWDIFENEWLHLLMTNALGFQNKINPQTTDERLAISDLHKTNVNIFYRRIGGAQNFISHSACFCCLREMAEHPLPCGHVLCTPCVRGYGRPHSRISGSFTLAACPLHCSESVFAAPWDIYFKPALAGVRVLSLDGGGMRGIVLLEVLRQIEEEFNPRIPIMNFFDLVVGTSTGGIVALGLGVKNWSVGDCAELFLKLVDKAFTTKIFGGLMLGTTKYSTSSLTEALQDTFKQDIIFGGGPDTCTSFARKVAVTSATETGEQAVIFTNYNRANDDQINYQMIRPEDPATELKLWEAARATSAAPMFFKPFVNSRTKEGYLDGAVFFNNPVRIANYESKLIWPDAEDRHPDILLSIGTGHSGQDSEGFNDVNYHDKRRFPMRRTKPDPQPNPDVKRPAQGLKAFPELTAWFKIFKKRMESVLDAERTWGDFRKDVVGTTSPLQEQRYIRINPKTSFKTPKLDEKGQIQQLREDVRSRLKTHGSKIKILKVAHRLVASSFYFEKSGPARLGGEQITVQGTIRCRFGAGSSDLRSLGEYIRKHQVPSFRPYFRIHEINDQENEQKILITAGIISDMIDFGNFESGSIAIPLASDASIISIDLHLTNDRSKSYLCSGSPISGFPQSLSDGEPLRKTSSPPSPAIPKRHSIRQKRKDLSRFSDTRPASDSNIDYTLKTSSSSSTNKEMGFSEAPNDISDWARRREAAIRPMPVPVQLPAATQVFELDSGQVQRTGSMTINQFDSRQTQSAEQLQFRQVEQIDEEDEDLARAIERSQHENFGPPRRSNTGTDPEELRRVIELSMRIQ